MKHNPKHELFVREFVISLNAKDAAIKAGYSPKGAEVAGHRLLSDPRVKALFEQVMKPKLDSLEISADRIRLERARMAFFDPAELFDEHGKLLPIRKMSQHARRAVSAVEVTSGDGGATVTKVKLVDRNPSLTALERMEGLYGEDAPNKRAGVLNITINL